MEKKTDNEPATKKKTPKDMTSAMRHMAYGESRLVAA